MADFGQDDEVVSKPAAATTKFSWGSNDDVVTPTAPATSASAPIDSGGGAAFGMYPKPGMKPMQPGETSSAGAFAASAAESVAATPGVLAGSRVAMAVTPPVMPYVGTLAKPIAGIVGGIGGGILASMGIKSLEQFADTVFGTNIVGIREQQQKESPTASLLGQVAGGSMNPWMRPTIPSSAGQALAGGGIMGVVGAGQRLIHGEDVFDPTAMAVDVGTGMFTKPTQRGERLLGITPTTTTKKTTVGDLPEKPPEGATPEEKATYVEKLKTIKTERDAKAPLVEAAIKNKSTGEIERMGPKHDQARKEATKDTHEEGFVDERGNFHERQAAVEQAKRAGQIPQDHVLESPSGEQPGLHSGDLRKVGDERFAITEDQPAGEPAKRTEEDRKKSSLIESSQDHSVNTLDEGTIQVTVNRLKDGGVMIVDKDGNITEYNAAFAKDKSDADLLKYLYEPVGHTESTPIVKESASVPKEDKDFYRRMVGNMESIRIEIADDLKWAKKDNDQPEIDRLQKALDKLDAEIVDNKLMLADASKGRSDIKKDIDWLSFNSEYIQSRLDYGTNVTPEERAKFTKELEDTRTKLDAAIKELPPVQFENPSKPTWNELQDHLHGSKTIGEAFDRVLKDSRVGTEGQRSLIKALNESPFIRDAKLKMTTEELQWNGQKALGIYWGDRHSVELGRDGDLQSLLHETIHAGTYRLIKEGKSAAAVKLKELYTEFSNKYSVEYEAKLEQFKRENPNASIAELKNFRDRNVPYGFTNTDEFIAEAFTNKKFQEYLASIKTETPGGVISNLWKEVKEAIRKGLNIPEKQRTVLDDVLEQGMSLVEESKGFKREGVGEALPSKATSSADEPTVEKDPKAKELANVIRKVAAAEKQSDPKDWTPEERAAYDKGWEEFSRVRGYSEQEIADFKKYRELTGEMISKYGEDAVMEFDMLVTKGEHPDFPSIKGSVDVADRMAAATSEPVAKEFQKLDPRSMPSEEAMLNHATDIYERYGEADAIKFFDDYKKNLNERSIPVPNNNEQLDDGMHKMNTFTVKDESEHVIGYKESTEAGVTAEDRAQAFLDRENGKPILGRLGEILKGIWDENLALVRKIKAMGGDVGEEYTTGQSRIRMWTDKNAKQDKEQPVGFKAKVKDFLSNETVKKFFSNDTPMGDKFAEQADAAIERKVFQTDDGRVIELHRQPEDTRVKLPDGKYREIKKGTEIWEWKDGRKQLIGHSDNLQLKRGDKFETKKFSDKLSEGPDVGTASEKRTLKPELTIIDGKVPEIERHSPYRYLHDAEASARIANMGLRKMARELEFIENLKKSELFKQVGHGPDQDPKTLPRHYVEPQSLSRIPQLRGWAFDPKTAAIIEDFAKVWDNNMYMKLSNALVKNMMLNPIPHMFNEVMHLWNARGFTGWVDPRQLGSFANTARVAWRDVGNQTQFYRDIMREGGSILGASPRNKGYFDTIIKDASKEMFGTPEMERSMKGLAKKLGTSVGDLYNGISEASQKAMWFTRDVMYVQLVREIMARQEKSGNKLTLKEAIDHAERHMPNYRLPSEVLGSRGVSKVLRDPRVSMFSRYHYGMVKSLVNTLKDVDPRNLKTPEGRQHFREGVDSMIAIGIAMNVLYPLMDKMAEAVFGEGAELRRAGPFHLIQAGLDVYDKKKDASALIWPVFTFNPMFLTLGQLGLNKKAFTGKSIYHPDDDFGTIMGDVGAYTAGQIPQVPPIMSATADEEGQTKLLARQFDIKVETEAEKQRKERAKKYQETSKKTRDRQREKETYRR